MNHAWQDCTDETPGSLQFPIREIREIRGKILAQLVKGKTVFVRN